MTERDVGLLSPTHWSRGAVNTAGLLIAAGALVATVVFGIRSEQRKSVAITYAALRPLLNEEPQRPSRLQVTIGQQPVLRPWLLSARLTNTGNQPIEPADIERPIELQFPGAVVLSAEISSVRPRGIAAEAVVRNSAVVIEHKLLNPNDWIDFQLLFDGEPPAPIVVARIRGLSGDIVVNYSQEAAAHGPFIIELPRGLQYLVAVLASIAPLLLLNLGWLGVSNAAMYFKGTGQYKTVKLENSATRVLEPLRVHEFAGKPARALAAAMGDPLDMSTLDDPRLFREQVGRSVSPTMLAALSLDTPGALERLRREIIASLPEIFSSRAAAAAPPWIDQVVRARIAAISPAHRTATELAQNVRTELAEIERLHPLRRAWAAVSRDDLIWASTCMLIALAVAVLVVGIWRDIIVG